MKKLSILILALSYLTISGFSQVISDFEFDTEGWHSEGDGDYLWESTVGNPGGCFRVNDDATGSMNRAYAPVKFLGDWSAATSSDYVSADIYLYDAGGGYISPNFVFRIVGPGGSAQAIYSPYPQPPDETWINYSVNLIESEWYVESGTWAGILSHITSFIVTMEYINGDEWNRMDNVTLSLDPPIVPLAPGLCSDFESGMFEGWSTLESTKSIVSSGGNPGKYLEVNEGTGVSIAVPSSVYHGDWSSLDEHNAEIHVDFYVTDIVGTTYLHDFFVKIAGPGGEASYPIDNSIEFAFDKWHSFGVPIEETGWTLISGDWATLMNFVDDIQIVAEFNDGSEVVGIDNFCISDSPPVANFVAENTYLYLGETAQFFDQSTSAPQTWSWDFGDSGTSTDVNPSHLYTTPGIYTVTLTTTNYYGNSSETKTAYIEVVPVDQCLKYEDDFDDNVLHPAWSFKNGTWSESSGNIRQTSNHYVSSNFLEGCFAMVGTTLWDEYVVSCDFYSSDNDYIGFVFNYQDEANMYMFRWGLEEPDRRLSKYENGIETVLASDDLGFTISSWYYIDIYSHSGNLVLAIDGIEIFNVFDDTFTSGKVGLYCWGNQSSYFDNLKIACPGTPLDLKVFLEGPFETTEMKTSLISGDLVPLLNPYYDTPWNHIGNEGVLSLNNPDIVDWVLVDFRDANSAAEALPATSIGAKAAFLLKDGQIVSSYDGLPLYMDMEVSNNLYIAVFHRNHLGVLSANALVESGGIISYDFTSAASKAFGSDQKNLGGIYGLYGGDTNADGIINDLDGIEAWYPQAGETGYLQGDANLDSQANNQDKNDVWNGNYGKEDNLPE